jgi:hypothetical protein
VPAPPVTAPTVPVNVRVSAVTRNTMTVSWGAPASTGGSAIVRYEIDIGGGGWFDAGLVTSWVHTGLTYNQTRTYSVRAVNSVGPGPAAVTTGSTPTATVTIARGGAAASQGTWCPSSSVANCRYVTVSLSGFQSGTAVNVQCWADFPTAGYFTNFSLTPNGSGSASSTTGCRYGIVGHSVRVDVEGVQSNVLAW